LLYSRAVVDRYIFVKLRDAEVAGRAAIADHVAAALAAAAGDAGAVAVGLPADDSAARWDLSIVVTAPDLAAWGAIAARAAAVLDGWLPARAEVIKAWTFARR
jgi:hypothetical protein